jgi:tetratricopeptide (TPR) repeat protein
MFTDIVGYSKMVQRDQSLTLVLVEEHNKIIRGNIENLSGKIIKFTGDGFMAEFDSSTSAVTAAIAIQKDLSLRNETEPDKRQITIRIGIHTGDVIREGDDLIGDGVNIASRIEGIAPHGGIAVSSMVWQSIKNEKGIFAREVGKVALKNITEPEIIYKVYLNQLDYKSESNTILIQDFKARNVPFSDLDVENKVIRIGVMHIKNLGDEEDNYLCHGITSGLLSEFAKLNEVQTPLLSEMLNFKETDASIENISKQLNVEYLVEGSLFKKGENCQITLQLLDAKSSISIWNDEFSLNESNIQEVKGSALAGILQKLNINVPQNVKSLLSSEITDDPQAYEFFLKGLYYFDLSSSRMDIEMARGFFKQAYEKDSTFIVARLRYAMTYNKEGKYDIAADLLEETLGIALDLNDQSGVSAIYNRFGILYMQWGKTSRSIVHYEKALKIQVKLGLKEEESRTLNNMGICYNNINKPEKAVNVLQRSIQLKKELRNEKAIGPGYTNLSISYLELGQYQKAFDTTNKAIEIFEEFEMHQSIGRVLITMGELAIYLQEFETAAEILKRGREVTTKINDTLAMGKITQITAILKNEQEKFEEATQLFEEAREQFELAEFKSAIQETSFQIAQSCTLAGQYQEGEKAYSKVLRFSERSDDDLIKGFVLAWRLYNSFLNGDEDTQSLNEIIQLLDGISPENRREMESIAITNYLLAIIHTILKDEKSSQGFTRKAQSQLQKRADLIADKTERNTFLVSRSIFRKIMEMK